MEIRTSIWDPCRHYLSKKKFSILDLADNVGRFVDGMINNFKI
jgi:hypothetical protein